MQQPLIVLINSIYHEIYLIEDQLNIKGDGEDYRPRIEYFHDAIRLLSGGNTSDERLSVEFLAYDVAMLRHIQGNPLIRKKTDKTLSGDTGLKVITGIDAFAGKSPGHFKTTLSDLYKKYSVLFSALLAANAENDYQERVEECNSEVEQIAIIQNTIRKSIQKQESVGIAEIIEQYSDDLEMLHKLLVMFKGKNNKMPATEANEILVTHIKEVDKQKKTIEQAHFNYATAQLAIYENAKEVVKKMAVNGVNIAGSFVEDALRTTGGSERKR